MAGTETQPEIISQFKLEDPPVERSSILPPTTRIMVAYPSRFELDHVVGYLRKDQFKLIVGPTSSLAETIRAAVRTNPDYLLLQHYLIQGKWELLRRLKEDSPATNCIVTSGTPAPKEVASALRNSCRGYLQMEGVSVEKLGQVMAEVYNGRTIIETVQLQNDSLVYLSAVDDPIRGTREITPPKMLSEREREVLRSVAKGLSNRRIASELFVSDNTIRTHLSHILEKLGVDNRVQAAAYALTNDLV
jgi:DNA-binding NarL/FixJ family response regulator